MKQSFMPVRRKRASELRPFLLAQAEIPHEPMTAQDATDLATVELFCAAWDGENIGHYHAVIHAIGQHIWDAVPSSAHPVIREDDVATLRALVGPNAARVGLLASGLFPRYDTDRGESYWSTASRGAISFRAHVLDGWADYRWTGREFSLR